MTIAANPRRWLAWWASCIGGVLFLTLRQVEAHLVLGRVAPDLLTVLVVAVVALANPRLAQKTARNGSPRARSVREAMAKLVAIQAGSLVVIGNLVLGRAFDVQQISWVLMSAGVALAIGTTASEAVRTEAEAGGGRTPTTGFRSRLLVALPGMALGLLLAAYLVAPSVIGRDIGMKSGSSAVRAFRRVPMTMRDGAVLRADLYWPRRETTPPALLVRMPLPQSASNLATADTLGRVWAERGYAVIIQSVRGWSPSEGIFTPFVNEESDGQDTIRWLRERAWFDGRIALWGGSYFGFTALSAASALEKDRAAMFVQINTDDWGEMLFAGGAFSLTSAMHWVVWNESDNPTPPSPESLSPAYAGWPLSEADDRVLGETVPYYDEWLENPWPGPYWNGVSAGERTDRDRIPTLLLAGWFDPFLPMMIGDFQELREAELREGSGDARLIIGPWSHAKAVRFPDGWLGPHYRPSTVSPSVEWFDAHLRPAEAGADKRPPVRLFVMGRNQWRDEEGWPLERAEETHWYLRSDGDAATRLGNGSLSPHPPSGAERPDVYLYDPNDPVPSLGGMVFGPTAGIRNQESVEARGDVLVYTSEALEEDMEVTGPVRAVLFVSTSARATDFTAKLVDVHPGGEAYNVTEGILRREYPEAGAPVRIEIELWPTSMLFRRGHKLRLEVSSSNYPRFDRHPNVLEEVVDASQAVVATQTVFHDALHKSHLVLPWVPEGPAGAGEEPAPFG